VKCNSSKNLPALALAPRFTEKAAQLLMDFANTHPEDLYRFDLKWGERLGKGWPSTVQKIDEAQRAVRAVWDGKFAGDHIVNIGLGFLVPRADYDPNWADTSLTLFHVNWEEGYIWASPRDLNDYVWLSLLQYSKRLAVCANQDGCPTPYFIRNKANQKYCSDGCALPAQQEFKRQWWSAHGEKWRQKRMKQKSRWKRTPKT